MLRLAACLATERGVRVVAPVHDAMLIEAPVEEIDAAVRVARGAMEEASREVLNGFTLRVDVKTVRHPDRYQDPRGVRFWGLMMDVLHKVTGRTAAFVVSLLLYVFMYL
jgi:hypothetical protein